MRPHFLTVYPALITMASKHTPAPAPPAAPTSQPIQYRIEETKCTILVTSSVPPSQWDTETIQKLFSCNVAGQPQAQIDSTPGPSGQRRRVQSSSVPVSFSSSSSSSDNALPTGTEYSNRHQRGRYNPGASDSRRQSTSFSTSSASTSKPAPSRPRIYFYHKEDPHYGFTNFSPHPVEFKGEAYPTSEHLFQALKVLS